MTIRRAAILAAIIAALVHWPALGNRYALDDVQIVERNPVAHSVGAAAAAFARPYWPPEHGAGLWRPAVMLSFALDWQASGGSTTVLHAVNVLLHALVTALLVFFVARYVAWTGALFAGLIFAVHPLHVEAVANLVGRAELLAAAGILGALLCAHGARARQAAGKPTLGLEAGVLGCVALALLSKEHAVIAIALVWLDDHALPDEPGRLPVRLYVALALLTAGWLAVRHFVDRGASFAAVAPAFIHQDTVGRLSTMMPVVFVILRLLVWPFDLTHDYRPLTIERLDQPTPLGVFGLIVLVATIALPLLAWKRYRVASLALMIIGLAWLPTSNLLFPTGIVLSERTLYLSTVGLALILALAGEATATLAGMRAMALLLVVIAGPFAARTWSRSSDWRSTRDLVLRALGTHPEVYSVHEALARSLWLRGQRADALREYEIASELYPLDPYMQSRISGANLEAGRLKVALRHAEASEELDSMYASAQQSLALILLGMDSAGPALVHARRAVQLEPSAAAESLLAQARSRLAGTVPDGNVRRGRRSGLR